MTDPLREIDPTGRFSDRVQDYVRYRPSYPVEVVRTLERETGAGPDRTRVVDLGCGTGISSGLFLAEGYAVTGVEPNAEMRRAAEALLRASPRFRIVDGRAERIPLQDSCCELLVVAQAFHWFEAGASRREMKRVLVEDGVLALFWNERRTESPGFLRDYEDLLRRHAPDYPRVVHRSVTEARIADFFGPDGCACRVFPFHQELDLDGVRGRARSSSYVPRAGQPGHDELMGALARAFGRHASAGAVRFEYDTKLYFGRLAEREAHP